MSLVHLVMPSARPAAEVNRVMEKWAERGYYIVLQRDPGESQGVMMGSVIERPYAGYPEAVNFLAKRSLAMDPECQWIVCAGDDTLPDETKTADEIAAQCTQYFGDWHGVTDVADTFGVMQPTGDRWGEDAVSRARWPDAPAYIDRICGSPWLGRSFCERINQGQGPLWHEYCHNWADEELQLVAQKLGILWQRRDLIHYHDHAWRRNGGKWDSHQVGFPADYTRFKPLFEARKRMNFQGSEPL